jgi:hypothetical protein
VGPQGAAARDLLLPSPQLKAALMAAIEVLPQRCREVTDADWQPLAILSVSAWLQSMALFFGRVS